MAGGGWHKASPLEKWMLITFSLSHRVFWRKWSKYIVGIDTNALA